MYRRSQCKDIYRHTKQARASFLGRDQLHQWDVLVNTLAEPDVCAFGKETRALSFVLLFQNRHNWNKHQVQVPGFINISLNLPCIVGDQVLLEGETTKRKELEHDLQQKEAEIKVKEHWNQPSYFVFLLRRVLRYSMLGVVVPGMSFSYSICVHIPISPVRIVVHCGGRCL